MVTNSHMTACKTCNAPNDSGDSQFVCRACGRRLISKIYNLATVRLALTITGWVGVAVILSFVIYMFAIQTRPGYIVIHNKRGGTATLSTFTFIATGLVLLAGAGGLLIGSTRVAKRISELEAEYLKSTGQKAVYDIRKPKPV